MKKNAEHYLIELPELGDERGGLAVIEECAAFPFDIKRVFYLYNTQPAVDRGNHANRESRFGLVSVVGSCVVGVDDGTKVWEYKLDKPLKVLILDRMVWKVMKDFSTDCILMVVSDNKYDEKEYIRDYNAFLSLRNDNRNS